MKSARPTYQLKYSKQFTTESANRLTQSCKWGKVSNEPVIWKVGKTQFVPTHLKGDSNRRCGSCVWFLGCVIFCIADRGREVDPSPEYSDKVKQGQISVTFLLVVPLQFLDGSHEIRPGTSIEVEHWLHDPGPRGRRRGGRS